MAERIPRQLKSHELAQVEAMFEKAKFDVRRFVTNDRMFLPPGTTDLDTVLQGAKLLPFSEYAKRRIDVSMSVGMPQSILDSHNDVRLAPHAMAMTSIVAGRKTIWLITDMLKDLNKTAMTQILLEELAHTYCDEVNLGTLRNSAGDNSAYYPFSRKQDLIAHVSNQRRIYGVDGNINLDAVTEHRAGCQLFFSETVPSNGEPSRSFVYGMPSQHRALEETRAAIVQTLFFAKVLAGTTGSSSFERILKGFNLIKDGGHLATRKPVYKGQILGYNMASGSVLGMIRSANPDEELSRTLRLLHNCSFPQLQEYMHSFPPPTPQAFDITVGLFSRQTLEQAPSVGEQHGSIY